jgi:hypothetical protein
MPRKKMVYRVNAIKECLAKGDKRVVSKLVVGQKENEKYMNINNS